MSRTEAYAHLPMRHYHERKVIRVALTGGKLSRETTLSKLTLLNASLKGILVALGIVVWFITPLAWMASANGDRQECEEVGVIARIDGVCGVKRVAPTTLPILASIGRIDTRPSNGVSALHAMRTASLLLTTKPTAHYLRGPLDYAWARKSFRSTLREALARLENESIPEEKPCDDFLLLLVPNRAIPPDCTWLPSPSPPIASATLAGA
jgi:hypothetical protein